MKYYGDPAKNNSFLVNNGQAYNVQSWLCPCKKDSYEDNIDLLLPGNLKILKLDRNKWEYEAQVGE